MTDVHPKVNLLITRPIAQGRTWAIQLRAVGIHSLLLPVLEILPVTSPLQRQKIKSIILSFDSFQKVIFVSQNAVTETLQWLDNFWPKFPQGIQYFAVGSSTARAASQAGLQVQAADEAMNSEVLLALDGLQSVAGQKVLICRGVGGRGLIGDSLTQRGASVSFCELYNRSMPIDVATHFEQAMADNDFTDTVFSVHSGESLANLLKVLKCTQHEEFLENPLIVPGERVAAMARELGFRQVIVATNATDDAMTAALLQWRGTYDRQ